MTTTRADHEVMTSEGTFTIRARLVILVILAIAPVVLERISGIQVGRADRLRLTENTTRGLARQGAELYAQTLSSAQGLMHAAALLSQSQDDADPTACGKALADVVAGIEVIDALSIATPEGEIVCSSRANLLGVWIGDRDYFKAALAAKHFTVRGMVVSRVTGRPVVPAALPYRLASGPLAAVVVSTLNLSWIEALLAGALNGGSLTALIIDRDGKLVASYPRTETFAENSVASDAFFKQIRTDRREAFTAKGPDGATRVFAAADLGDDAFFVVGIDRAKIMANIDHQITVAYSAIIASVIFALLAAIWGSERVILRPLRALAGKAVRYGRGDFTRHPSPGKWPPEFVLLNRALERMAQQLAAREEGLLEENRQLDHLAQVDGLTGVANRRCFDEKLRAEWAGSRLSSQSLCLLMIDVDYFKRFNDRYGHRAGDSCLKSIADCISGGELRATDFVARYGGEEFAVILPALTPEAALEIAERLRQRVFDLAMENRQSPKGRVTISVGVAGMVASAEDDSGALIEAADAALYNAKRCGRDAVSGRPPRVVDVLVG